MATKAESRARGPIIRGLRELGFLVDANPGSAFGGRGRSDLTVCAFGRFFAFEIKVPGEQPTDAQRYYGRKVNRAGGVWAVIHTLQDALAIIEEVVNK